MEEGLKTLFALYKGTNWSEINISEEALSAAKRQGYLFDYPRYESHSETLNRRHDLLSRIDPQDVANAFLFSLSTRKLEYRSALGSYYFLRAIPAHELMKSHNETLAAAGAHCYLCGWRAWKTTPGRQDIKSGYNFDNWLRYKYGGSPIGDMNINYALFDLEQFIKLPKVMPAEDDKQIFLAILSCVEGLNGSDKAGRFRAAITKAKILKSNQDELSVLLGALGICGILAGNDFPTYDTYFANEYERAPAEYKNDFAYPVNRWHVRDGVNTEKLNEIFGFALTPSPDPQSAICPKARGDGHMDPSGLS